MIFDEYLMIVWWLYDYLTIIKSSFLSCEPGQYRFFDGRVWVLALKWWPVLSFIIHSSILMADFSLANNWSHGPFFKDMMGSHIDTRIPEDLGFQDIASTLLSNIPLLYATVCWLTQMSHTYTYIYIHYITLDYITLHTIIQSYNIYIQIFDNSHTPLQSMIIRTSPGSLQVPGWRPVVDASTETRPKVDPGIDWKNQ